MYCPDTVLDFMIVRQFTFCRPAGGNLRQTKARQIPEAVESVTRFFQKDGILFGNQYVSKSPNLTGKRSRIITLFEFQMRGRFLSRSANEAFFSKPQKQKHPQDTQSCGCFRRRIWPFQKILFCHQPKYGFNALHEVWRTRSRVRLNF